jgi:hypothetical protein
MTDAKEVEPNVRATRYFIVESRMRCPRCEVVTAVFAFALPAGYESLIVDDDTPDDEREAGRPVGWLACFRMWSICRTALLSALAA